MNRIALVFIGALLLSACGKESSPDGRSQLRDEKIQTEIDSIKIEVKDLQDSIGVINQKLENSKLIQP